MYELIPDEGFPKVGATARQLQAPLLDALKPWLSSGIHQQEFEGPYRKAVGNVRGCVKGLLGKGTAKHVSEKGTGRVVPRDMGI